MLEALGFVVGAVLAVGIILLARWSSVGWTESRCYHPRCRAGRLARTLACAGRELARRPALTVIEVEVPELPPNLEPGESDPSWHGACCSEHWEILERRIFLLGIRSRWEPKHGKVMLRLSRS
jgi:hypothetical protein